MPNRCILKQLSLFVYMFLKKYYFFIKVYLTYSIILISGVSNILIQFYVLLSAHWERCSHHTCENNIIDYIPYVVLLIFMTDLFYNWKFLSLNPLHLFNLSFRPPPLCQPPVCSPYSRICLLIHTESNFRIQQVLLSSSCGFC